MTATTDIIPSPAMPWTPGLFGLSSTALGSDLTFTFNGANDKIALLFQYDGTNIPDLVSFVVAVYTSTGGVDCTLETVDTSCHPNGAVTNSATVSATVSSTGVKSTAAGMAGTATLTAGTIYAVVLTATGTPNFTIKATTGSSQGWLSFPFYLTKDSAGAWSVPTGGTNSGLAFAFKNAGGNYFQVAGYSGAFSLCSVIAFNNSTNPDERGNRFSFPVPKTVIGALIFFNAGSAPGANDDWTLNLYTSHTATRVQQKTQAFDGNAQGNGFCHLMRFPSGYSVAANTVFALAVKSDGTEDVNMVRWDYAANADLGCMMGTGVYSTTANNGSDFTDDNAKLYAIFPIFSQYDDGAGGSGGVIGSRIFTGM